jgi:chromosome segregation ATPase
LHDLSRAIAVRRFVAVSGTAGAFIGLYGIGVALIALVLNSIKATASLKGEYQAELGQIGGSIKALDGKLDGIRGEINGLRGELQGEVGKLRQDMAEHEKNLAGEISELRERVSKIEPAGRQAS